MHLLTVLPEEKYCRGGSTTESLYHHEKIQKNKTGET